MGPNSFGQRFTIHTFGESHGPALGVVIDGCPAGVPFDRDFLIQELERRRPGLWQGAAQASHGELVSQRKEADLPEILSGVFEEKTLGTPICIVVRNTDARSADYEQIKSQPRTGHADDVWRTKFHHTDHRGGGRSSGRETVSRVMGGAVARMLIKQTHPEFKLISYCKKIGPLELSLQDESEFLKSGKAADEYLARFPSPNNTIEALLTEAQKNGDSYGGIACLRMTGLPVGLGQPVFHKLKADLAMALFSIGAVVGVEIGDGFSAAHKPGKEFHQSLSPQIYGGIRGGISTGEEIIISVAVKPTSSILDIAKKGRHDPCILIRAIPVIESMVSLVIADHILWCRTDRVIP